MKKTSRKEFIVAGISLATLWATFRWWKQPKSKKTMKFLTQEGKLVELDLDKMPAKKQVASKTDILNWVVKK